MSGLTIDQLEAFVDEHFPQARGLGWKIEELGAGTATLRLPILEHHLRPGDTVSGPVLMSLVDTAMYFAILGAIGPVALAVTTNLNISFLRRYGSGDLIARAETLKLGRRLAVGHVFVTGEDSNEPIAHATLTYSIPPR